jgi:sugar lactone lactonase YvrE
MPSDDYEQPMTEPVPDSIAPEPEPGPPTSQAVTVATGQAARARRRKLALLALLLLILALLAYTVYYFEANRRLPLPRVVDTKQLFLAPQYLYSISGEGKDALTKPIGVGVGKNDRVYAVDFGTRTIKVFTTAGGYLFSFNAIKDGAETTLKNPVHLAIADNGDVWVTDRRLMGVYVFDKDGTFLRKFLPDNEPAFDWLPFGIAVDQAGDVYVTDIPVVLLHRVFVFAKDGAVKTMFGQAGQTIDAKADPGKFSFPNGIVIGPGVGDKRDLFIADSNNRRVQVYSPSGTFRRMIATEGTPRGIVIDAQKRLYVVDVLSQRIDVFTLDGRRLGSFGESGYGPGQFQYPEDVALDGRGRIYISDRENNQVQVWGYPTGEIPGVTALAKGQIPWACLAPLPLLLIPLLMRRRRFVVTADFVEAMVLAELVAKMTGRRWRWIVTEETHLQFAGRVVEGIDLGQLLEPETYSHSDASALSAKLGIPMERAAILAMAKRYKTLCTEDSELARLAVLLDIDVYDRVSFVQRYAKARR